MAATVRLRLTESMKGTDKVTLNDVIHSYLESLRQGTSFWKVVPCSMVFLFFSTIIMRVSFAMVGSLSRGAR
jgi:hypothetical protein